MDSETTVKALAALAQESRLSVFRLLVEAGAAGRPAGEIAQDLGIAPATLSFHLGQLANAGLVTSSRKGRSVVYRADYDQMDALMKFLYANCCAGEKDR